MDCKFIKYFEEPKIKYNCLSSCLFFKDNYIKITKNLKAYNATQKKINLFYENLLEVNKFLLNGTYPENLYLRIYYDDSIYKNDKYVELINILKKNSKIQLVKYYCTKSKLKNIHINMFGTLIRFYTIFDNESKNIEYTILADSDNIFTKNFFTIFNNFMKGDNLVYTFNSINQSVFHSNDFYENNKFYNYIYLLGGLTIIKKDKIFLKKYWNKYFNKMYKQNDLMYIYNYIDFKKYSMISLLKKDEIKIESLYSFVYGTDEVWLNYVIKKILLDNNKINKLGVYLVNDYNFKLIIFKLNDLFKLNNITNEQFKLFIENCDFLKDKNYNNLSNYMNNLEDNDIIIFFKLLKNNPYFDRLYIQNNIKFIINNIEKLLKLRGKLNLSDIMTSKKYYKI